MKKSVSISSQNEIKSFVENSSEKLIKEMLESFDIKIQELTAAKKQLQEEYINKFSPYKKDEKVILNNNLVYRCPIICIVSDIKINQYTGKFEYQLMKTNIKGENSNYFACSGMYQVLNVLSKHKEVLETK